MNIKNLSLGLAAVALILSGIAFSRDRGTVVVERPSTLGALVGPDIPFSYLSIGGVRTEYRSSALATATTTPCALQAPSATSTLRHASLRVSTATSTATVWTASKATTAFATTTAFDQFSLGSGAFGTMHVGTASSTAPDENSVIAPDNWIVWGVQGTIIADSTKLNGTCSAVFEVI
jgi:hypothetical protein